MNKTYLLAVLLMLPFTGCIDFWEDEVSDIEEARGYFQEDRIIDYDDWKEVSLNLILNKS